MTIKDVLAKLFPEELFYPNIHGSKRTKPQPAIPEERLDPRPAIVHGTARVVDGKIVVTNPKNDGSYATIIVPEEPLIQVFIDGLQVYGEAVVSESHSVDVKTVEVPPSITYETLVSDDELSVAVQVAIERGVKLSLKDRGPSRRLILSYEKHDIHPSRPTPESIFEFVSTQGYSGTIDFEALNRLCKSPDGEKEIVVRGVPPKDGREIGLRVTSNFHSERDNMIGLFKCAAVPLGTTIAVLEPEIHGTPGTNVFNVPLLPKTEKRKIPRLGTGVTDVNGDIVASIGGRPILSKRVIDVVPELVIDSDISGPHREIAYEGNVVVNGSITNQVVIKAQGSVTVYGSVRQSSVFANRGVFVKGDISKSTVIAGHHQFIYDNLSQLLDTMISELHRFIHEYELLKTHAIHRFSSPDKIPNISLILFEHRHTDLCNMIDSFVNDYPPELPDHEYKQIQSLMVSTWIGENKRNVIQEDAQFLLDQIVSFKDRIKNRHNEPSIVRGAQVAASTIRCDGNIILKGSCSSSSLESTNTISIIGNMRGGFAVARKSAYFTEVGNPAGVETSIKVLQPDGCIRINLNHSNTLLEVHGTRSRTHHAERNVRFRG